jgi:hypothetical protein
MTEDGECPQIGRCNFAHKTCGNAVLSTGLQSDGVKGCNAFKDMRDTVKYHIGDVFEGVKGAFGITDIQYEYRPALYRVAPIGHGAWSETEESLNKYKQIYKADKE